MQQMGDAITLGGKMLFSFGSQRVFQYVWM